MAEVGPGAVVKVGGSLLRSPSRLARLCERLGPVALRWRLALVPGGGPTADLVRRQASRHRLPDEPAHAMAIAAMDLNARLLCALIPGARLADTPAAVAAALQAGATPVLLTAPLLEADRSIPEGWSVTSDSLAVYLARRLGAPAAALLKRVAGIRIAPRGPLSRALTPEGLEARLQAGDDTVDPHLPQAVASCRIPTWILAASRPERIEAALSGEGPSGTLIDPGAHPQALERTA